MIKALMTGALLLGVMPAHADQQPDPSAIPFSSLASPEARRAWEEIKDRRMPAALRDKFERREKMTTEERHAFLIELRAWDDETFAIPLAEKQKAAYRVDIVPAMIGGVYSEIFTPASGILPGNSDRVLINLHGGAFQSGARVIGRVESIPIAAVAGIKVISVDYRQAPEFHFPAATEDVVAVYRELLKTYKPGNIGIYGCSAGGTLTAQVTASLIANKMPRPGAIGMFCGTGEVWAKGDSSYFWDMMNGATPGSIESRMQTYEYIRGQDTSNPLLFPMRYPKYLAAFPPALLISGTRSFDMSTIVDAHEKLTTAGVDADLHIWEGVTHAFFYDPSLPESQEAYGVIAKFFAEKLGPWYRAELQQFVADDLASPPARCAILFTGSSSIKLWTELGKDMAPARVLNRGFGGSTIADINETFDHVITPYWPRAIFFYAGENDLSLDRRTPAEVLAAFERFMAMKTARLGDVPVYFLSIKPSKLRWEDLALQQETNRLIERFAAKRSDLHYVDIATPMLDNGTARDIFREDNLHMTLEGYRIWTAKLRPLVQQEAARAAPNCTTN